MVNRLGVTHKCDRQTDRQAVDSLIAYDALRYVYAAKNDIGE